MLPAYLLALLVLVQAQPHGEELLDGCRPARLLIRIVGLEWIVIGVVARVVAPDDPISRFGAAIWLWDVPAEALGFPVYGCRVFPRIREGLVCQLVLRSRLCYLGPDLELLTAN